MIEKGGEFTRVDVDEAGSNLGVVLRRAGIHRGAAVNVEVMPKMTDEEVEELQTRGLIKEDAPIKHYDYSSTIKIDEADRQLSSKQVEASFVIAETLAALREVDSARVRIMGIYRFGDCEDYLKNTVLLVRR